VNKRLVHIADGLELCLPIWSLKTKAVEPSKYCYGIVNGAERQTLNADLLRWWKMEIDDEEIEQRTIRAITRGEQVEGVVETRKGVNVFSEYCPRCKEYRAVRCLFHEGYVKTGHTRRTYTQRDGVCPTCGAPIGKIRFERI